MDKQGALGNPWKDPLYQVIAEYGGLAIPKGEREEWTQALPLGLRRTRRPGIRQPDAFVQAGLEDGVLQQFGVRDTNDLLDQLTARLPHLRTRKTVLGEHHGWEGEDPATAFPFGASGTVVGEAVPRGRRHRPVVYETSSVLWERPEKSRSKQMGIAINPWDSRQAVPLASIIRHRLKKLGYQMGVKVGSGSTFGWIYFSPSKFGGFSDREKLALVALGVGERVGFISGNMAAIHPGNRKEVLRRLGYELNPKRRPAVQYEAFKTRDIMPGITPGRIPVKVDPDVDLLAGFRPPKPEKQMRMFNPVSRVRNEKLARTIALERGVSYGLSVIDGWYYVGTSKELAAVGAIQRNSSRSNGRGNPSAQHSPVWRKGFTAGIAAKARGAVRGNPPFKELRIGDSFRFASEREWPYSGLAKGPWVKLSARTYRHADPRVPQHVHRVGSINADTDVVQTNPLTRGEVAGGIRKARSMAKAHSTTMGRQYALGYTHALQNYAADFKGANAAFKAHSQIFKQSKRNPLTRRETARVLKGARISRALGKRSHPGGTAQAFYEGSFEAQTDIARRFGQAKKFRRPGFNPRIVGHAGRSVVFRGTKAQAATYAKNHGLEVAGLVPFPRRARA